MMTNNIRKNNHVYTLKNWRLEKTFYGLIVHGMVYNNPKFKNGYDIHTSPVLSFETGETEHFAHTLNSIYSLPVNSHTGNEDMQELLDNIESDKQKAFACAEKLLSEGDCLFFEYNVFYRTNKGIICLNHQSVPHQYVSYKYESDDFELCSYTTDTFTVRFNEHYSSCALYELSFYNKYLKKNDYRFFDISKNNIPFRRLQHEQFLPF